MASNLALSEQDEKLIQRQLATGDFTDATDVVRAGLQILAEVQDRRDHWLRDEVSRRMLDADSDPSKLLSSDDVFADIEARHQQRIAQTSTI